MAQAVDATPTTETKFSVLVCTHRRPEGLERLLDGLAPQVNANPDREIVVVNDGTHDDEYARVVGRFGDRIRYESLASPSGIAVARNRSAALARGQYLVFTDDDCEVPAWWLDWVDATLRSHPELDVLAGTARPLRPEAAGFFGAVQAHYPKMLPFPEDLTDGEQRFVTACLALRSELFRRVGGFSTDPLFAIAGEDTELSARLVAADARTRIETNWYVYHALSTSLLGEMRRKRRYGAANAMMARLGRGPVTYRRQDMVRRGQIPARFWRQLWSKRPEVSPFQDQPLRAFAARMLMALVETSYEYGLMEGWSQSVPRSLQTAIQLQAPEAMPSRQVPADDA